MKKSTKNEKRNFKYGNLRIAEPQIPTLKEIRKNRVYLIYLKNKIKECFIWEVKEENISTPYYQKKKR